MGIDGLSSNEKDATMARGLFCVLSVNQGDTFWYDTRTERDAKVAELSSSFGNDVFVLDNAKGYWV